MTNAIIAQASTAQRSTAGAAAFGGRKALTEFTRAQVESALIAAGNDRKSTDSDIRRLTTVQIHMVKYGLNKIENEAIDDEQTIKLLDYFCTIR